MHTHMTSTSWLELLVERSRIYTVEKVSGGANAIHRGGAPFMTLTPPMFDYGQRIREMDRAGIDVAIVSLTCPNVYWGDAAFSEAAAQLVNDDMAEAQVRYPDRIRWLCSLPWQYPDRAIAELDRALSAGALGVIVLGNIDGAPLTDARFAPVWEAIDRRRLPVFVHPTTPPGVEQLGMERYHLAWSVGFTFDTTLAVSRMILDGFFDRYAALRLVAGHAGGYLPFLVGRLDCGFRSFDSARESITKLPSKYLERIHVDCIVYSPEALRFTIEAFGPERVMYGSDYPHKNGKMEEMLELVGTLPGSDQRRILSSNAAAFFGL
jgi:aminocarboxymuconate-semialdehyde decarboxylase